MVFIIAEMSANHCQNYTKAEELVRVAKQVGADAIKIQTYTPDTLTIKSDRPEFLIKDGIWKGKTLYELYEKAYMPWEWQPELKKLADKIGIELFSTVYDKTSVDFCESMGLKRYKIASFELVDLELIEYVAEKRKPMIISTGMASMPEIERAVFTVNKYINHNLTLLHCVSAYPSKPEDMNLVNIPYISNIFKLPVGLSDHTLSTYLPSLAVSLGACVIEKHITLSRKSESPDNAFSLEPPEFEEMVNRIRWTETVLGNDKVNAVEQSSKIFRRSLFAVEDIKQGELFTSNNVRSIRPSNGLPPYHINRVIGKTAKINIEKGSPLTWEMIK